MSGVKVSPNLLHWARERSGKTQEDLAAKWPSYPKWESGEAMPTMRQLEDLAKKTRTPFGYFFLQEPPKETLPVHDYRTMTDEAVRRPSPDLIETLHTMERRQAWMSEYLREQGAEPLPFFGSATVQMPPVAVAIAITTTLQMQGGWAERHGTWEDALTELREAVERIGVLIVVNGVVGNHNHRKLDPQEFRGFVLPDEYAPLIFVNGTDAKSAQMFTIAHELAHVWLGKGGLFDLPALSANLTEETERWCNAVAAEFLVPAEEFLNFWTNLGEDEDRFRRVAKHFKVSPIVAARRALDLGAVTLEEFFSYYAKYKEQEVITASKKPGGGDFYATQNVRLGKRFARTVITAAKAGHLLYKDAYRLTDLTGNTFDAYAEKLGIRR